MRFNLDFSSSNISAFLSSLPLYSFLFYPPLANKICGIETETGVCFRLRTHLFPPLPATTLPLSAVRRKSKWVASKKAFSWKKENLPLVAAKFF
jgi:hypothetical protein